MKPSSAKAKGRRLQDHVRERVMDVLGIHPLDIKCAIMGESGADHHLSSVGRDAFPYSTECKNVERINIWKAIEQAQKDRVPGTTPIVVFARNRTKPQVAIDLEAFLELQRRANSAEARD